MNPKHFEYNPLEALLVTNYGFEYVIKDYLDGYPSLINNSSVNEDFDKVTSQFPEKYMDCRKRTLNFQSKTYRKIRNGKCQNKTQLQQVPIGQKPKVAVLCFSHGALVNQFNLIIKRNNNNGSQEPAKYCCISAQSVENKVAKCVFDKYDQHIPVEMAGTDRRKNLTQQDQNTVNEKEQAPIDENAVNEQPDNLLNMDDLQYSPPVEEMKKDDDDWKNEQITYGDKPKEETDENV